MRRPVSGQGDLSDHPQVDQPAAEYALISRRSESLVATRSIGAAPARSILVCQDWMTSV